MPEFKLPTGYSLEPSQFKVPEGYSMEPQEEIPQRPPAPLQGLQAQTDPAAVAAARLAAPYTQQGPRTGRPASEVIPEAAEAGIQGINQWAKNIMGGVEARRQGLLSPEEERQAVGQAFSAASMASPAPVATGMTLARARAATPAEVSAAPAGVQAEYFMGQAIPRGIERESKVAKWFSERPWIGRPLREEARATQQGLEEGARRITEMPAGRGVVIQEGGDILRNSMRGAVEANRPAYGINKMGPRDAVDTVIGYATSKGPDNLRRLGEIRGAHTKADWEAVQGSILTRMSQKGGMDEIARNWTQMSPEARKMMFPETAPYINAIAKVNESYARPLAEMAKEPTGRRFWFIRPMNLLTLGVPAVGMRTWAGKLAQPKNAAAVAQWTTAYDKFVKQPSAASMAGFQLATRNMSNTLEIDIDPEVLLSKIRENIPQYPSGYDPNASWSDMSLR